MKITRRTKFKDIQPFLWDEDRMKMLKDGIPTGKLKKDVSKWTCGDFVRILNNEEPFIMNKIIGKTLYAIKYIGKMKAFEAVMKNIHNYLKQNDTKTTDEEQQAMNGVNFPTMQEQIFLKVQERFGLKSFDEVEDVPLSFYLLICKDESSKHKYENKLQKVYDRKRKLNSKMK